MSDTPISDALCGVPFIPAMMGNAPAITMRLSDLIKLRDQCKAFEKRLTEAERQLDEMWNEPEEK